MTSSVTTVFKEEDHNDTIKLFDNILSSHAAYLTLINQFMSVSDFILLLDMQEDKGEQLISILIATQHIPWIKTNLIK